jgi:hypothetical protein
MKFVYWVYLFIIIAGKCFGQQGGSIRTKDGEPLGSRREMISHCLTSLQTDETNTAALQLCNCQVSLLDSRYATSQVIRFQKRYKDSAISKLIKQDTAFDRELEECLGKKSFTSFLRIPAAAQRFKDSCKASLKRSLSEKYDSAVVEKYCGCAVNTVKEKRLTESGFNELFDPNSLLYNEVSFYCGGPVNNTEAKEWKPGNALSVKGTASTDTIKMIALDGMQKLKLKLGTYIKVAMLDCCATDILIPETFLKDLLKDSLVAEKDYLGKGKYELANGNIIECKRYLVNNLVVGKFIVSDVVIAAVDKPITILVGRSLLNKFRRWNVDNEKNWLILEK